MNTADLKLSLKDFDDAHLGECVYTPEYGDPMSKQEFIDLAGGDAVVARNLFDSCEWQHPSTLIDEHGLDFFHADHADLLNADILYGRYDGGMFLAVYKKNDDLPIYKNNNQNSSEIAVIVGKEIAEMIARDEGAKVDGSPDNYRKLSGNLETIETAITALADTKAERDMKEAIARQDANRKRTTGAITAHAKALSRFMPTVQLKMLIGQVNGEEGEFFTDKLSKIHQLIDAMPKTYDQDGLGDEAVVYLHYFKNGANWYITERDIEDEQQQAFGLADLFGDGGELGYISIEELKKVVAELDLYWTPKTLRQIRDPDSEDVEEMPTPNDSSVSSAPRG